MSTYFGIDYGSKLTGNTVIAILDEMHIHFMQVEKKVDADQFIRNAAQHFKPTWIFLDAPLSLPGVYCGIPGCHDYHFRQADKACHAMSPMFLGGLAARAIELKDQLQAEGIRVFETYPKIRAGQLGLPKMGYKQSKHALAPCARTVAGVFRKEVQLKPQDITTWHHLDALLALMSAMAHECGECQIFGHQQEGQIYV